MLHRREDYFYYVTVTNENYVHPQMPGEIEEGVIRGIYRLRGPKLNSQNPIRVRLLGAGAILREVIEAAQILETEFGISADVFSVTSFSELRKDGLSVSRWNRLHPEAQRKIPWITQCLGDNPVPTIATSDYVSAVADLVRPWVCGYYVALGTDGFGRSDTRAALREFFEVDRRSIAYSALTALADCHQIPRCNVADAIRQLDYHPKESNPWEV
jgi:pyruvate dehydrogenase E1 component